MKLNIINIKELVQVEEKPVPAVCGNGMSRLNTIKDAWLTISNGVIEGFGEMSSFTKEQSGDGTTTDARGKLVFPCWCDSHTHLVFAGHREGEFVDRIKGLSYEEIAARGGGILNSAARLKTASEEELLQSALERLNEIKWLGTGAVEIKSGYGLSPELELKMLKVIKKLKEISPLTIKATFLGAHAIPAEYRNNRDKYVSVIVEEMLPAVAQEKLADFCDVFCERNFFTGEDTIRILEAAARHGIRGKIHAEQLSHSGGISAGVACNALSVDHIEFAAEEDIRILKKSETMPTILPGAQFFLGLQPPPVRKMIDAGLPLAIASDYNPGSCPSGNMNFMISLACIKNKMTPEEAVNAATINSAYAMGVSGTLGSIAVGKKANVFITREIPSYNFLPYSFANNLIEEVILNGEIQSGI